MDKSENVEVLKDNEKQLQNPMEKLEDALVICKFGRLQIKLMFTSLMSVFATTAVTTTTSYILPSAECDLKMTMLQKGLLNAIPFLGQICACMFTGFMTDTFGRKIFLAGGNLAMFFCAVLGASSQTYGMLLSAKLLEGIVMSLVFTATATFVTEFTHRDVRDRVLIFYTSFMSTCLIVMALVSWFVLPQKWDYVLVDGYFEIHSWNIYLYVNALWSLIAALLYGQFPESPKFLLSHGQEKKALKVLKTLYRINTGNDEETFPITTLAVGGIYRQTSVTSISFKKKITDAMFEMKELFRRPLVFKLLLFSTTTFVCLLSYSALRLWYPQLSTIIETYQLEHNGNTDRFCVIIDDYRAGTKAIAIEQSQNITETQMCIPKIAGAETYTNGLILGFVSLICICFTSYLVNFFGQKWLMFAFMILSATCSGFLYWTNSSIQIAILVSATCGFMQAAFSLQHNILVRVFPTTVRTVALSIVIMFGRVGSLAGNILFPWMLQQGCMVPFLALTIMTAVVATTVYFFPNPNKQNNGTGDN